MLKKDVQNFIYSRLESCSNNFNNSNQYKNIEDNIIKLFKEIFILLPKQKQSLLWQYEDNYSELLTYNMEESYIKGFKDCITIFSKTFTE